MRRLRRPRFSLHLLTSKKQEDLVLLLEKQIQQIVTMVLFLAFLLFVELNHKILVVQVVDVIILVDLRLPEVLPLPVYIQLVMLPGLGYHFAIDVLRESLEELFLFFSSLDLKFYSVGFLL